MSSSNHHRNLTLAALAVLATSLPAGAQCVDFDPPPGGAWGCCGANFISDGVNFETRPFVWTNGLATNGGVATIVNACNNMGGHSLWSNNINLDVKLVDFFGTPEVRKISFFYDDFGGNVNLRVNGMLSFAANEFHTIPAAFFAAAGVVNVSPPPVWTGSSWRGHLVLEALPGNCIGDFAVGGQELCLDDFCADPCGPPPCPEDIDGSGAVDFGDILAVLASWGPCAGCPADLNGDTNVDFSDLLAVLSAFGSC